MAAAGLASLVQLSAIELHTWGCMATQVGSVDTLVFDLDPGESVPPTQTIAATHRLRRVLRQLGFKSLLKATGGKGLHVMVPGVTGCSWPKAKAFSQLVADCVVAADAEHFTATLRKMTRQNIVLIDYFRNGRGNTSIAPYAPRTRVGLPVARPLAWGALGEAVLSSPWDVPTLMAALGAGYVDP